MTVLGFLARPDDAEFFCAGTLIRLAQYGRMLHYSHDSQQQMWFCSVQTGSNSGCST